MKTAKHWLLLAASLATVGCSIAIDNELDGKPSSSAGGGGGGDGADGGAGGGGGYQPCGDMPCDCSSAGLCGDHACPVVGGGGACACALGYVAGASGCEWSGVVDDPELDDPSAWEASGTAVVDAVFAEDGVTLVDPGAGVFDSDATCAYSEVSQTVQMPPYSAADPFVLSVDWQSFATMYPEDPQPGLALGIAGRWHELGTSPGTTRICLGANGYGGAVELTAGVIRTTACPPFAPYYTLLVDHVEVLVADPGECPAPNTVLNGDFEAVGGWTSQPNGTGSTAEIQEGIGTDGSRGLRLATTQQCSAPSVRGSMLVPLAADVASPAIEVRWTATSGRTVTISNGRGATFGQLVGTGTARTSRVCLPPWAQGTASPLVFALSSGGSSCLSAFAQDATIDDVQIVTEHSCGTDDSLLDGGFELATNAAIPPVWRLTKSGGGIGTVEVLDAPAEAHGGNGVLHLTAGQVCTGVQAANDVVVPPASPGGGPALRFWYRTSAIVGSSGLVVATVESTILPESLTWTEGHVCLAPGEVGRTQQVSFSMSGGSGACANLIDPEEEVYIDDLVVGTHPDCPTL